MSKPGDPIRDAIYTTNNAGMALQTIATTISELRAIAKCGWITDLDNLIAEGDERRRDAPVEQRMGVEAATIAAVAEHWERQHPRVTVVDQILEAAMSLRSALDHLGMLTALLDAADTIDDER